MTQRPNQPSYKPPISRLLSILCFSICLFIVPIAVSGQSDSTDTEKRAAEEPSIQELQKDYDAAIEELRDSLKVIKRTGADFYESRSTEAFAIRAKWEAEAVIAETAYDRVRKTAFALFFAVDNPDEELMLVIQGLNRKLIEQGKLSTCYRATKKLLDFKRDDPELTQMMGRISILTNDFDNALEFYDVYKTETEAFGMPERALYNHVASLDSKFKQELELRQSDAAGEPLPHAILKLKNKETLVIELFENQAPETVGNFVNLVETGFYDGIIFHRVLKNILADTGKMTMNRAQPIGYTIYDEANKPDARHHFRGSVTMALINHEANTGAAEFRIMLVPGPNLDGKQTVFGRVISDLSVLDEIQETFTINEKEGKEEFITDVVPDMIESITLKRLRSHEYEPNRVKN